MPNTDEVAIYPCRDGESGEWFCEVQIRETGMTWFRSDFRRSRCGAIRRAKQQITAKAAELAAIRLQPKSRAAVAVADILFLLFFVWVCLAVFAAVRSHRSTPNAQLSTPNTQGLATEAGR